MTGPFGSEILALADMPAHLADWADLATRSLEPCVFVEPAFAIAAARHLVRPPGPVFILVWSNSKGVARRLVGLCPAVPHPMRGLASAFSHPQATSAFPLLDRDEARPALAALLEATRRLPGRPAALLLTGLPVEGETAALIRQRDGADSRWLDLRGRAVLRTGGAAADRSGKARKELRRQARRMTDLGAVATSSAGTPEEVRAALQRFLVLEASGWKGRRGTALGSKADRRAFVREASDALCRNWQCRIESLSLGEATVAMGIVLRSRDRAWFWKIAFDEAFARFSPGVHLTIALTEALAADASLTLTDSCAVADHPMIDRLWPERMTVGDVIVATGSSWPRIHLSVARVEYVRRLALQIARRLRKRLLVLRK